MKFNTEDLPEEIESYEQLITWALLKMQRENPKAVDPEDNRTPAIEWGIYSRRQPGKVDYIAFIARVSIPCSELIHTLTEDEWRAAEPLKRGKRTGND